MDRLKLVITEKTKTNDFVYLMDSKRKYKHIEIKGRNEFSDIADVIITKLSLSLITIRTFADYSLGKCLPNVEEIFFISMSDKIEFYEDGIISNAQGLKTLNVWGRVDNPKQFTELVKFSKGLKKLGLEFQASQTCCPFLWQSKLPYELETLYVDKITNSYDDLDEFALFLEFLKDHHKVLRNFKFKGSYRQLKEILETLPHLNRLTFTAIHGYSLYFENLLPHEELKEANLILVDNSFIESFLNTAPNIEVLYVSELKKPIMQTVLTKAKHCKLLKYAYSNSSLEDNRKCCKVICNNTNNSEDRLKIEQI